MIFKSVYKRYLSLIFLSLFSFSFLFSNNLSMEVYPAVTKPSFKIKMYSYTPNTDAALPGTMGSEITTLYPGQEFLVSMSLDNFDGIGNGYEGIAGISTAINYDSGVVEYLGIPNSGVSQDATVGGDKDDLSSYSKGVFDLALKDQNTNGRLKFANDFYVNNLLEYSAKLDHANMDSKIRSVYFGSYYQGSTFVESNVFKSSKSVSENNNILTYLFKVKDNPVKTAGYDVFDISDQSLSLSFYSKKDLVTTGHLVDQPGQDNIFDKIDPANPLNPVIGTPAPENITDTIKHINGERSLKVNNLFGRANVPTGTEIKVYGPDKITVVGTALATADGPVDVLIRRTTDNLQAISNLGGDFYVEAIINGNVSPRTTHNLVVRENIINSVTVDNNPISKEVGYDLTTFIKDGVGVMLTYHPSTGREILTQEIINGVDGWTFENPADDTSTPGDKKIIARIKDDPNRNIYNRSNLNTALTLSIKHGANAAVFTLGDGNALPEDIASGEADTKTIYNYVGFGFRDNFRLISTNGNDVTGSVKRTVTTGGSDKVLTGHTANESLSFFTDNAGTYSSFIKKDFIINYEYTDVDGVVLKAKRKVILVHRLGDINRDGTINGTDSTIVNNYVLGIPNGNADLITPPPGFIKYVADVDRNGMIDLGDGSNIVAHFNNYKKIKQYYTFVALDERMTS